MNWFGRRSAGRASAGGAARLVTYADWSGWFEAFARGGEDDDLLARAASSELTISSATVDSIGRRAVEALDLRLAQVGTMLQNGLRRIRGEQDAVRAILNARSAFVLLRRYAELPCWPDALRNGLSDLVDQHVAERQKNLLRNAAEDRTGQLATAIRNNPLDRSGLVAHRPIPSEVGVSEVAAAPVGVPAAQVKPRRSLLI